MVRLTVVNLTQIKTFLQIIWNKMFGSGVFPSVRGNKRMMNFTQYDLIETILNDFKFCIYVIYKEYLKSYQM